MDQLALEIPTEGPQPPTGPPLFCPDCSKWTLWPHTCQICQGKGERTLLYELWGPLESEECPKCHGSGTLWYCPNCDTHFEGDSK